MMEKKLKGLRNELNKQYKNSRYNVSGIFKHTDAVNFVNKESRKYANQWRDILFCNRNLAHLQRLMFVDLLIISNPNK